MAATVIESDHTPFRRVEVDPVDLDIIENALRNARHEMDAVLFRTAMSPGIREQHDEFPSDRQSRRQDGGRAVRRLHQRVSQLLRRRDSRGRCLSHQRSLFLRRRHQPHAGLAGIAADFQERPGDRLGRDVRPHDRYGRPRPRQHADGCAADFRRRNHNSADQDLSARRATGRDILQLILHNCRMPHWNRSDLDAH